MITYRKAEERDKKEIIAIERSFYKFDEDIGAYKQLKKIGYQQIPELFFEKMFEDCLEEEHFFLLAVDGDTIAGYVYVEVMPTESADCYEVKTVGHIDSIFVLEEYRGKGLGTELINRAVEWLQSKAISVCTIGVRVENEAALDLYQKLGFEVGNIKLWKEL
ncbi:MAG: hypothetical protein RIQ41_551 [Candidatus Parcubacteria bacterium]|jgi:ribosomal protein S18 acetylase RimI-like enzyme